jgi:diaminopimelate epimerase
MVAATTSFFSIVLRKNIDNLEAIAKQLCDRRFGIGADQLLTIHP